MKVSYEWLKEIININNSPKEIADSLTLAGLEVEKVIKTGIGEVNVVAVEIIEMNKHPDADKLFVTKVNAGTFGDKQIVTNVKGLEKGMKILAALEGVKLATGLEIKKAKLKGVESEGMFVGWEELGIDKESKDLFYLDSNVKNGTNYQEIIPFNDSIIDIELESNRGDCLGMVGVSREVKSIFNKNLIELEIDYKTIDKKIDDLFKVEIKSKNCLRYTGGVILDVEIIPSPYWMQLKLIKAGIRPINNVVDITNYILLECNQPLHAFDMDKIKDKKLIIRDAKPNEKITTLDDIERKLESDDILISGVNTGHCIGGIMGGQISEVSDETKNIFLEAAYFRPENIRKTSKRLGLSSESSYRFERGIDKENVDRALKRALYMFDKLGVGKVCSGIIDVYPGKTDVKIIKTNTGWINNKLGTDIEESKIIDILSKLGFQVKSSNSELSITVPSWRNDIIIKEDVSEEVARIYGYNNIKHTHVPSYNAALRTKEQQNSKILRELMYRSGCDETVNYSFNGDSIFNRMLLSKDHPFRNIILLETPLTEDWAGMRNTLIPGMIKTASFNANRQAKGLSLYELGNVSIKTNNELPDEEKRLAVLLGGEKRNKDYANEEVKYDFYDIKGIIDNILDYFHINASFKTSKEEYLHPYQQAEIIINGKKAGVIGKVHPLVCESFDINYDIFITEVFVNILFEEAKEEIVYDEVPKIPSSFRDLSILDNNSSSEKIINAVLSSGVGFLRDVKIFDRYPDAGDLKGISSSSTAIRMEFNKMDQTLTDEEINNAVNKILKNLEDKCGAKIRE